ncbi:hypothetical protein AGABI1DRAFT_125365 [Agaricus bisporus var. burnettii JB137-S8]|uniref:Transcription activator of gluconeogenesis ERT1 n=2 Tax=Agaricus bisporus var. burnettii TaxID=192524 RepID=K5XHG3_AGABU|nr:uncharacterized protein AGABI1DRAFT_125365 [Agaricus bisporus var. burnettii JB137-S8]EKM82898.1 hypothetical protein AGABI1DRAFT_125365 [Agaricus bisporus var. burnettii JB137-S8]KAF7778925.1 hypothetical protein Agabi119p4_3270 [Agaricus bisporus var. burnettii]
MSVSPATVPLHMYPFGPSPTTTLMPPIRPKRRQVKNACTHCQKACKKCDDARPCLRCVKYGVSEECINSKRKERKKGIKRGPYKKRDGRGRATRAKGVHSPIRQSFSSATAPVHPASYAPHHPFSWYTTHVLRPNDSVPPYPYYVAPQHVNQGGHNIAPACYPVFHTPFPAQAVYPQHQDCISQMKWN